MTPNTMDCGLVITLVQSTVPVPVQPARCDPLKCAYVSYADTPRPATASANVVNWNQGAGPCLAAAASAASSAATRHRRPPRVAASVLLASSRGCGPAGAGRPGVAGTGSGPRVAGADRLRGCHPSFASRALMAGVHALAGWLPVSLQMAAVR